MRRVTPTTPTRVNAGPTRRRSDRRGFTLVEMVVVMVIMGMLTAMATSSFTGVYRHIQQQHAEIASYAFAERTKAYAMLGANTNNPRTMTYFQDAQADLIQQYPDTQLTVTGIEDVSPADGIDDDGKAQVTWSGQPVCVSVGATPMALVHIQDGPCAA